MRCELHHLPPMSYFISPNGIVPIYLSINTLYTRLNCRAALYTHSEVRMKTNDTPVFRRSFHTALGSLILALLLCSCSLSGNTTNTPAPTQPATTQPAPISTPKPVPTQSPQHPIANQPPGAGNNNGGGIPLPINEVKPLTFNLIYNDAAIEHDIAQIHQPGSPSFHHYLTAEQIRQRYTISDPQLQQVKTWLTQQGYTIVAVDPLRSSIQVQGTVATIQNSLHIKLQAYTF